jgi:hypothetical protein
LKQVESRNRESYGKKCCNNKSDRK